MNIGQFMMFCEILVDLSISRFKLEKWLKPQIHIKFMQTGLYWRQIYKDYVEKNP